MRSRQSSCDSAAIGAADTQINKSQSSETTRRRADRARLAGIRLLAEMEGAKDGRNLRFSIDRGGTFTDVFAEVPAVHASMHEHSLAAFDRHDLRD